MVKKDSTEFLNEKLLRSSDVKEFFKANKDHIQSESFGVALGKLIDQKGMKNSDLFESANISPSTGYHILNGRRFPSRDKVLQLTIGLSLNLYDTNRMLKLSKHGELYVKDMRDAIIIFSINNQLNLIEINEILYEEDLKILD